MENKSNQKQEYKNLIKAALFVSGRALSIEEIASAIGVSSIGYLKSTADELVDEYKTDNGPFTISTVNDKYELSLKEPYASKVNQLAGSPEMSRGAMKVLAYVSKNEPVLQSSIVKAIGSSCYGYVKELIEKEFISARRSGRTKRLETTKKFKEYFSLGS